MKKAKVSEQPADKLPSGLDFYKAAIRLVYEEAAERGERISSDVAVERAADRIHTLVTGLCPDELSPKAQSIFKTGLLKPAVPFDRKLRQFALDEYYKTYHPKESGRGRPRIPEAHSRELLEMAAQGLNHGDKAERSRDPEGRKAKEKFRKRVSTARRRLADPGK